MRRLNVKQANTRRERIARRVEKLRVKKTTNEYLAGMAARGFVPVPETIEELQKTSVTSEESNGTVNS